MNCFQFCIFAVLFTTCLPDLMQSNALWIAFNFVSLQCYLQRNASAEYCSTSCELLSILYLCSVIYNKLKYPSIFHVVVNCFQFCIFAVLFTTFFFFLILWLRLWIAFNFVSLQCYLQHNFFLLILYYCCELLSILYLCSVIYNLFAGLNAKQCVVNCFQFCIFAVLFTTNNQ